MTYPDTIQIFNFRGMDFFFNVNILQIISSTGGLELNGLT